jgi:hypothetical protein
MPEAFPPSDETTKLYPSGRRLLAYGAICATVLGAMYLANRGESDQGDVRPQPTPSPSNFTFSCAAESPKEWQTVEKTMPLGVAHYARELGKSEADIKKELMGTVECNKPIPFRLINQHVSLIVDDFEGRCALVMPLYKERPGKPEPSKINLAICNPA